MLDVGDAFEGGDERSYVGGAEAAMPAGRFDERKEPALSPGGDAPAAHLEQRGDLAGAQQPGFKEAGTIGGGRIHATQDAATRFRGAAWSLGTGSV